MDSVSLRYNPSALPVKGEGTPSVAPTVTWKPFRLASNPLPEKVGPSDERYGASKHRLALEAGATDCSFRLLFWNRAATAKVTKRLVAALETPLEARA